MALGRGVRVAIYRGDGVEGKELPCHQSMSILSITVGCTNYKRLNFTV
jgi:hypothetical protein